MSTATAQIQNQLDSLRMGIELLSSSTNAQDLCRRVAHSDLMGGNCFGVAVYLLNQKSVFIEVASYGRNHDFGIPEMTSWDDTVIAKAVRARKMSIEQIADSTVCALPIQHAGVITGAWIFTLSKDFGTPLFTEEVAEMISSISGMFLENKGLSLKVTASSLAMTDDEPIAVQELTSRQVHIIKLIAEGMTNAEIAKKVLLSESTVRQETIRIFRILKCHNRSEAIVKARATGIISELVPASE